MTEESFIHVLPSVYYFTLFFAFTFGMMIGATVLRTAAITAAKKVAYEIIGEFNRSNVDHTEGK